MSNKIAYTEWDSPVGRLLIAGDFSGLRLIRFPNRLRPGEPEAHWEKNPGPLREAVSQLNAYFDGTRRSFNLPLAPEGTPFQLTVWEALSRIPYGETVSYGQLADTIGKPRAARAVGGAVGKNPVPIVLPCHRIIGADGSLTGFGGGLDRKTALLSMEKKYRALNGG
ncbi:MAG: methylated-DNA--[protein]-cysteine S-methyltransferase [Deltaproteobacteria bacterium]|nr:methylated-DNA--[protein]-cysteine S-methyltransferase [Deltaproteobacteria bacterium]